MASKTTNMIHDTGEFFLADLNCGGIRIGMNSICSFDFPIQHPMYDTLKHLEVEFLERAFDMCMDDCASYKN